MRNISEWTCHSDMHHILECVQIVRETWDQITCFWTVKEGERKIDEVIKKMLPEFKDKTLDKMTYTIAVTKKEKTLKIFSFIFLLLTVWTHIFGFLLYLTQLIVVFFKKRDLFFRNIQYFIFLPLIYLLINFQQLKNFFSIKEFPVPQKSFEFFFLIGIPSLSRIKL